MRRDRSKLDLGHDCRVSSEPSPALGLLEAHVPLHGHVESLELRRSEVLEAHGRRFDIGIVGEQGGEEGKADVLEMTSRLGGSAEGWRDVGPADALVRRVGAVTCAGRAEERSSRAAEARGGRERAQRLERVGRRVTVLRRLVSA